MIPESSEHLTVDLYESEEFPFRWTHRKTLLSGIRAFDSTLLRKDGKIWLFCTVCRHKAASPDDDLHIYYTDDLLNGDWTPHRLNPVKSDPYGARPAGAFWETDGEIYRPAQRGVPAYGSAMVINKITTLNELEFSETTIQILKPGNGFSAMHTLNGDKEQVIVDLIPKRFKSLL